jgi:hypothetical protein
MLTRVECKVCKAPVRSFDKNCHACATPEPGKGKLSTLDVLTSGAVLALMLWGLVSAQNVVVDWYDGWRERQAKASTAREAGCKVDLTCWGDRFQVDAEVDCSPAVEKLAKFSARWTNQGLDLKFSHYRWHNLERSYVAYIGDNIQFQNGYGSYQRMTYTCVYDTVNKKIVGVQAQPGML